MKTNKTLTLKKLFYIATILILFAGCQTDTAFVDPQIAITDQAFLLSEKSPSGTMVGQIVATASQKTGLYYYLIADSSSKAFFLNDSTGELFVLDTLAINYNRVQQISLKVMAVYSDSVNNYSQSATIKINIKNEPDWVHWISDRTSDKNKDAVVNSLYPTMNQPHPDIYLIDAWTNHLTDITHRTYLQFNLDSIPSYAEIIDATLHLCNPNDGNTDHFHSSFTGLNTFYVRRVTSEWDDETLSWNNQPNFATDGQVLVPASQKENQDYSIDVTEIIKERTGNPQNNVGFVLMLENEAYYRRVCFASLNYPDTNLRPKLEINYLK